MLDRDIDKLMGPRTAARPVASGRLTAPGFDPRFNIVTAPHTPGAQGPTFKGRRHVPKGDMNINCEHGTVILRGEVDSVAEVAEVEERVRRIPGVRSVQNLLHPHGTPAPNKARSRAAG